jgi:hypothetical protein
MPGHVIPPVPMELEVGWVAELVWMICGREKSIASCRNRTMTPQSSLLPSHYTDSFIWSLQHLISNTNYEELLSGDNSHCVPILFNTNNPSTSQDWFLYLTDMLLILFLAYSVYISIGLYWVLFITVQELSCNFLFFWHKVPNFKDDTGQFYNMISLDIWLIRW